jgi:hypothetical protein
MKYGNWACIFQTLLLTFDDIAAFVDADPFEISMKNELSESYRGISYEFSGNEQKFNCRR